MSDEPKKKPAKKPEPSSPKKAKSWDHIFRKLTHGEELTQEEKDGKDQ